MEKIILNNGQEIDGAMVSDVPWAVNKILVLVPGTNVVEAAIIFGNTENSQKIEYYHSIFKDTYRGYTTVDSITVDSESVRLQIWLSGNNDSEKIRDYTVPEMYLPDGLVERSVVSDGSTDDAGSEN